MECSIISLLGRKLSLPENEDQLERRKSPFKLDARNKLDTISSAVTIEVTSSAPEATEGESKPKQMKGMIAGKMKIGSKFGKRKYEYYMYFVKIIKGYAVASNDECT